MNLPSSQLTSEDLKVLFEQSAYVEKVFFPPEVPTAPVFEQESTSLKDHC